MTGTAQDCEIRERAARLHIRAVKPRYLFLLESSKKMDETVIGARAWVKNEDYWNARWRILEEIKLKLDENEIEMAYPHLTVQMGKEN